ncbi:macro domain-containing protein [Bifidobacterium vespertilionis]|uniref:macro domain-containing protein n=1 Tax=Bifidobacterium vespertilionis TaxID=2562524 RepID=UPI001BDD39A0|nr:macro domain-containing protein [Bifidobacterium vespertilionis]MBT1179201.1 macro domain-containing protein [Bifidobacterium vespertilionis]
MPLQLVREDITRMRVDAIVNAANTRLLMGGGVCGAIFRAAGARRMREACDRLSPIQTGEAVATPGFDLPARYVIHTAGPVWHGGGHDEERLLRACYRNALALATKLGCTSIAFPLISSGIYGYPKPDALRVAIDEIRGFLDGYPSEENDPDVYLCVFDRSAFTIASELDQRIREYIDDHYASSHEDRSRDREREMQGLEADRGIERALSSRAVNAPLAAESPSSAPQSRHYDERDVLADLDEPFNVILLRLIDAKDLDDVEVYKRANISRKLFSKIRCGNGYMPGKKTVLALAIALRLDIDETDDLLACAGYALSRSVKFDVIVEFFIVHGIFDVFAINETLFRYDQPLLGQ